MKHKTMPKVNFFYVKNNQAKLQWICTRASEAMKQETALLIMTPNEESATYIDQLLWRLPEESFIPHALIYGQTKELIAVTTVTNQNLNQARRLLYLCSHISPIYHQFEEIDELYDDTHPQKMEWSKKRLSDYQTNGAIINRLNF